ncbi:DUF2975 domain-containing protein [Enterococcus faecium]|uniref:DUF2975 domain-containing protein n=1 Tax=Enterococcus faecium TaxID=1352 RepID=UPI002DB74926|nr:DUF2975 domain-containing protein [Enterococcus faecium]MEB7868123.1 DUF2975 domain-containing protein [Enterococcus faecium]
MKFKTLLLKFVVLGISAVFILFGVLFYTQIATSEKGFNFDWQTTLFVSVIYFALLLGIVIAYFLLKLLKKIEDNQAFSTQSLNILKKIERTILFIGFAFFGLLPKFMKVADLDDAPSLMLVGIAVVFIPFAVYTLTSVLEKLLEHAILLKTDHDLTV